MSDKVRSKKKRDMYLLIGIIAGACALAVIFWAVRRGSDARQVVIKVDGSLYYSESIENDDLVEVSGYEGGHNTVVIKDGKVSVTDADCPDKICISTGTISAPGETIVCMPHRVVIEIEGGSKNVDSVVN